MFPEKSQSGYNSAPRPSRTVTCPTARTPSCAKPIPFNYSQHTCNEWLDQPEVVLRRPVVRQIVVHQLKGFLSPWRRFFGLACMLIRRFAKMLAENVDCAWPGFKKEFGSQKNSS
jgi:hypothetical protein